MYNRSWPDGHSEKVPAQEGYGTSVSHARKRLRAVRHSSAHYGRRHGKDGRNFGGQFSITGMTEVNNRVHVTLTLQMFNYSGQDLQQAAVTIRESHPASGVIDIFNPIAVWRNGKSITIAKQVTITREEYLHWTSHGQPNVSVAYRAADGRQFEWTAQSTERPRSSYLTGKF